MVRIERDLSSMEYAVRPLLEAATTEGWRNVLKILFLSGPVTLLSEELPFPCLVSAEGPYDEVEQSVDLLKGKANIAITPIIKALGRLFFLSPKIITMLQRIENVAKEKEEEVLQKIGMISAAELRIEFDKYKRDLVPVMVQGASALSGLIAIGVFESLLHFRASQIHSALDEDEYENMIEGLRKFGLIESKLQVSLCPECANYQLTVSMYPSMEEMCPRCGAEWATITLYNLQPPYSEIKINNSDLPLFISSYLKHKLSLEIPMVEAEIIPGANIKSEDGTSCEVDVYIPEFSLGIECKVFEDAFARMTTTRLSGIIGKDLLPQIKKYLSMGIKNITIVTNLIEESCNKLKTRIEGIIKEEGLNLNIELLTGDIDNLIKWLDEKASIISKTYRESLEKVIKQSIERKNEIKEMPEFE
jgi:hypothetical protein